jgi:DNA-binding transcriptional LysR family regulator
MPPRAGAVSATWFGLPLQILMQESAIRCHWYSFATPCEWRVRTVQALDQSGRRWRTAFESGSLTAIQAAVRAGVGVATLLPGNVEFGMTILDPAVTHLPSPPDVELALYRRPGLRGDAITDVLEGLLWKAVG